MRQRHSSLIKTASLTLHADRNINLATSELSTSKRVNGRWHEQQTSLPEEQQAQHSCKVDGLRVPKGATIGVNHISDVCWLSPSQPLQRCLPMHN